MKAIIYASLFVTGFMLFIGMTLYACTVNIVQTRTQGSAKDVGDLTARDIADINAKLMLP